MILSVSLLEKVHLLSVTENLLAVSQYSIFKRMSTSDSLCFSACLWYSFIHTAVGDKKASTGIMYKNVTILLKFHIQTWVKCMSLKITQYPIWTSNCKTTRRHSVFDTNIKTNDNLLWQTTALVCEWATHPLFSYKLASSFTTLHECDMIRWKKNAFDKKRHLSKIAAKVGVCIKWWMCMLHAGSFCNSGLHPLFTMSNLRNVGQCITSIHLKIKKGGGFLSKDRILDFTAPTGHIHHQNKILNISVQVWNLSFEVMSTN